MSRVLSRSGDGSIELKEGAHFVFGGDAVDQGLGDLAFVEELVALYKKYPVRCL